MKNKSVKKKTVKKSNKKKSTKKVLYKKDSKNKIAIQGLNAYFELSLFNLKQFLNLIIEKEILGHNSSGVSPMSISEMALRAKTSVNEVAGNFRDLKKYADKLE